MKNAFGEDICGLVVISSVLLESTTDQAVEFYIKISQDKKQRDKYYSTGNNKNNRATTEDPYIEFLQSKLKQSEQKHEQRTLSTFVR